MVINGPPKPITCKQYIFQWMKHAFFMHTKLSSSTFRFTHLYKIRFQPVRLVLQVYWIDTHKLLVPVWTKSLQDKLMDIASASHLGSLLFIAMIPIDYKIKTHGNVSCGPTDKCVFYANKEYAIFTHLQLGTPLTETLEFFCVNSLRVGTSNSESELNLPSRCAFKVYLSFFVFSSPFCNTF